MRIVVEPRTLEKIWKTEFDAVFLQCLDQKTSEVLNERTSLNRLGANRASLRGLKKGSRPHVAASIIVQRGGCTSSETPLSSDATGFQSLIQEVLVECWARHTGYWLDDTSRYLFSKYGHEIGSGSESHVYKDGAYVIKEWKTFKYESLQLALDRITIHNTLFPETAMEVLKFGRTSSGNFAVVLKQPFIEIDANIVSDREVIKFMDDIGFEDISNTRFNSPQYSNIHSEFANQDFYIADLHKENIVSFTRDGDVHYFVLDCAAYFNTPGLGFGGTYDVGEPETWAYKNENNWKYKIRIIDNPLDFQ